MGDSLKKAPRKVLLDRWNAQPFPKKLLHRWWYPQRENELYGAVLALEAPSKRPANKDAREEQKRQAPATKGKRSKRKPAAATATAAEPVGPHRREEQKRQAPATKGKRSKRKHDGLAKAPSGGAGGAAPPPASASRAPTALADDEDKDGGPVYGDTSEDGNVKELLSDLAQEHSDDHIIAEKIEILSQHYTHFRRIREDGSCFYRAFLFSYLENLGQLEDRLAEATRLMEHVATSKDSLCGLELDKAYFTSPELSSVMAEFNAFVKSIAKGPSSDELTRSCFQAMNSPGIISLLRLLAEFDIRIGGGEYESFYPENFDAIQYCFKNVRPMGAQAKVLAIRGLTYALGIPLRVEIVDRRIFIENVDRSLVDEIAEVERFDLFPLSELDKGPDHSALSYWRSITTPTPEEMGSCSYLLSFDSTPLLTLMWLHNHKCWYILYRK
ncbi:unnamed protein product [Alopecurus aequalis]